MKIRVLYFAAARERAGRSEEPVELPDGATAAQALDALCAAHPGLAPVRDRLRVAIDQEFAPLDRTLRDGCELALIPPVAGG